MLLLANQVITVRLNQMVGACFSRPYVFILREIHKAQFQDSEVDLRCASFSPSPISFKPLIKQTSGSHRVLQRERPDVFKETTRWCHFSLIVILPIAVAAIVLSNHAEAKGRGHDSDRGLSTSRLREEVDGGLLASQESQQWNHERSTKRRRLTPGHVMTNLLLIEKSTASVFYSSHLG